MRALPQNSIRRKRCGTGRASDRVSWELPACWRKRFCTSSLLRRMIIGLSAMPVMRLLRYALLVLLATHLDVSSASSLSLRSFAPLRLCVKCAGGLTQSRKNAKTSRKVRDDSESTHDAYISVISKAMAKTGCISLTAMTDWFGIH
jgi:hypothetical protein